MAYFFLSNKFFYHDAITNLFCIPQGKLFNVDAVFENVESYNVSADLRHVESFYSDTIIVLVG